MTWRYKTRGEAHPERPAAPGAADAPPAGATRPTRAATTVAAARVLSGDAREAALALLADRIAADVEAYLRGVEDTSAQRAQNNLAILTRYIRPAVAEYNREAGGPPLAVAEAELGLLHRLRGSGPLEALMADGAVTDIFVRSGAPVYVDRDGRRVTTDLRLGEEDCDQFMFHMMAMAEVGGEAFGRNNPRVVVRTPRARITAVHKSVAPRGTIIAIRMFPEAPWTGTSLAAAGMFPAAAWSLLRTLTAAGLNGAIAGETGTGKTSLTQALAAAVDEELRLVTIEAPGEFTIERERFDQLEVREPTTEGKGGVSAADLVRTARRIKPEVLILGEALGGEAWNALGVMQMTPAMSLLTLHADEPESIFPRLEAMCYENPEVGQMPLRAVRQRIKDTISFAVLLRSLELPDPEDAGGALRNRRVLTDLVELQDAGEQGYVLEHLLVWEGGRLCWTGNHLSPRVLRRLERAGLAVDFAGFPRSRDARRFLREEADEARGEGGARGERVAR